MKLKFKYIGLLPACFLSILAGCEDLKFGNAFLEKPISTDVTIDTVFSSKKYAEQALAEVYHSLPDYLPTDGRLSWGTLETITDLGENTKAAGAQGYYNGTLTAIDTGQFPYRLDPAALLRKPLHVRPCMAFAKHGFIWKMWIKYRICLLRRKKSVRLRQPLL